MLVSSLMADYANSSAKLSIASRASQCYRRCWRSIGLGFAFSALFISPSQIFYIFIESCSFVDETSPF